MSASRLSAGPDAAAAELIAEWVDRLHAGENDAEAFITAHPEHADTLRRLLPAVRVMADLSSSSDAGHADPDELLGELGDYRIHRELGRGGMGVVYEAEQVSLRRRVALKVLPWAAAMDPKQLQRFKNEALAAASLKHDHIVSVYAVGCERGVHYYAMEFIDGRSMAAVIDEMRQGLPSGSNGSLVPQGASGDLPPSPGFAGEGPGVRVPSPKAPSPPSPLPQSRERGAGNTAPVAALTTRKTGLDKAHYRRAAELIAQAADALEHAHSLGIVHRDVKPANLLLDAAGRLYVSDFGLARFGPDAGLTVSGDLLGTLRYMSPEQALAKHGLVDHRTDVYSLGATLYELLTLRPAVEGDDKQEVLRKIAFEESVPLRKLDRALPAELETVTLKCLAKAPAERYATAGELADDLRRWTTDRAIKARPPGLRERAARWARRHRSLIGAAAAVLVVVLIGLVAGGIALWQKEQQTQAALQNARENLRVARDVVGKWLPELSDLLADVPGMEKKRRDLMQHSLRIYQAFLAEHGHEPEVRVEAAEAYTHVGDLQKRLGQFEAGETSFRSAIEILRPLTVDRPADASLRRKLGHALNNLGTVYINSRRWPQAELVTREAISIRTELTEDRSAEPDDQVHLAGSCCNLAHTLCRQGGSQGSREAEALFRQGITLIHDLPAGVGRQERSRRFLYDLHEQLSVLLFKQGRDREGAVETVRLLEVVERLVADYPHAALHRASLAKVYTMLASLLAPAGVSQIDGIDLDPERTALVPVYQRVGATKEILLRKAFELQMAVVADYPHNHYYRSVLRGMCASELVSHLEELGRIDDTLAVHRRVNDLWRTLLERAPGDASLKGALVLTECELGRTLQRADRWDEAEKVFRELLSVAERTNEIGVSAAEREDVLYRIEWNLVWCLTARPRVAPKVAAEAVELAARAVARFPDERNPRWVLGLALCRAGRWEEAVPALQRSLKLDPGDEGWEWFLLAMAHHHLGRPDQARDHLKRAVEWLDRQKPQRHELRRFRAEAESLLGAPGQAAPGPAPPPMN